MTNLTDGRPFKRFLMLADRGRIIGFQDYVGDHDSLDEALAVGRKIESDGRVWEVLDLHTGDLHASYEPPYRPLLGSEGA